MEHNIDKLIEIVKGKSAKRLSAFLECVVQEIDLLKVEDEKGYSLLHIATFKKFSNDFEQIICSYVKKQTDNDHTQLL